MGNCKYCSSDDTIEFSISGVYTQLCIEKSNIDGSISLMAYGDDAITYYPKYCPECGRKLEENENKGGGQWEEHRFGRY